MRDFVEASGLKAGQVFGLMRIAITGQRVSPPLFESMEIIGKEVVMGRMHRAMNMLRRRLRLPDHLIACLFDYGSAATINRTHFPALSRTRVDLNQAQGS